MAKRVVASFVDDPPYSRSCAANNTCADSGPGIEMEFLDAVMKIADPQVVLNFVEYSDYELSMNATAQGAVDITASRRLVSYALDMNLVNTVDPESDDLVLFIKRPIDRPAFRWLLLSAFSLPVWALLLFAAFAVYLGLALHKQKLPHHQATRTAFKIGWYLFFTIWIGCYSNLLAINLAVPSYETPLPFRTLDELSKLLAQNQCKIYAVDNVIDDLEKELVLPDQKQQERFLKALAQNPIDRSIHVRKELVANLLTKKDSCRVAIDYMSSSGMYKSLSCNRLMELSMFKPLSNYYAYAFHPNMVNRVLAEKLAIVFADNGPANFYYNHLSPRYAADKDECHLHEDVQSGVVPIKLLQLVEIFGITVMGISLACVLLIIELRIARKYKLRPENLRVTQEEIAHLLADQLAKRFAKEWLTERRFFHVLNEVTTADAIRVIAKRFAERAHHIARDITAIANQECLNTRTYSSLYREQTAQYIINSSFPTDHKTVQQ